MSFYLAGTVLGFNIQESTDGDRQIIKRAQKRSRHAEYDGVSAGENDFASLGRRARRNNAAIMFYSEIRRVSKAENGYDEKEGHDGRPDFSERQSQ